jgi:electron transfer flavoprotein alpha subunit
MPEILVLAERTATTSEPLALAAALGQPVAVVPTDAPLTPDEVAALGSLGAIQIVSAVGPAGALPRVYPGAVAAALAAVAGSRDVAAVLLPGGRFGAEVGALLAAQLGSAVITNIATVNADLTATKSIMAGTARSTARITQGLPIFTVKAGAAKDLTVAPVDSPTVTQLALPAPDPRVEVIRVTPRSPTGSRPDLLTATAIVAAGRGVNGNLTPVEELADALGAAIGASRAAVDQGWVDHSLQVGQTGQTVTPALYVAAGISGAVQHQAGMRGARFIVAVNQDPDAPIFAIADLGLVGDLNDFLPQAAAAVRASTAVDKDKG